MTEYVVREINAPPKALWHAMSDVTRLPEWSPMRRRVEERSLGCGDPVAEPGRSRW